MQDYYVKVEAKHDGTIKLLNKIANEFRPFYKEEVNKTSFIFYFLNNLEAAERFKAVLILKSKHRYPQHRFYPIIGKC